jgi:hypothetical protein
MSIKNKIIYISITVVLSVGFFLFGFSFHPNVEYKTILIKNETQTYPSEFGFAFTYPKDMSILRDSEDESHIFVVQNLSGDNKDETATGVVISVGANIPLRTPLEWLKSKDSGADITKGYGMVNIDGQEAISLNKGTWVVFNTPDNKRQVSIATLPFENPSQLLQEEMSSIVSSIVFTK